MGNRSYKDEFESFKLDTAELDSRAAESYSSYYLMLIGLIQSLSTGYLIIKFIETKALDAFAETGILSFPDEAGILLGIRFIISFTAIVIVSHEYMIAILMFRRYPNYFDIISTLAIGISQVLAIHYIFNERMWWLLNGVFLIAAVFGYLLTLNVRLQNLSVGSRAAIRSRNFIVSQQIFAFCSSLICFAAFLRLLKFNFSFDEAIWFSFAYLLFGTIIIVRGFAFLKAFRRDLSQDMLEEQK